jgi:hypothetical protein
MASGSRQWLLCVAFVLFITRLPHIVQILLFLLLSVALQIAISPGVVDGWTQNLTPWKMGRVEMSRI